MAIARQNNSLKQIYSIFNQIADNHNQINDFGKGDIFRINSEMKLKHPTLWVDVQPSTHNKSVIVMNFRIYIMDIVDQSDFGEVDVQSETLFILNDVIQLLQRRYRLVENQYNIQTTPFEHKFNDRVTGWFANIQVRVPTNYGTCDIPSLSVVPIESPAYSDPMITNQFLLKSDTKSWIVTISDDGNLTTEEK